MEHRREHAVISLLRRPTEPAIAAVARYGDETTLEHLVDVRSRFAFDFEVYRAIDVALHRLRARLGEMYAEEDTTPSRPAAA